MEKGGKEAKMIKHSRTLLVKHGYEFGFQSFEILQNGISEFIFSKGQIDNLSVEEA